MDTTMTIRALEPLITLKGHTDPIISIDYAQNCFLGQHFLASGSGSHIFNPRIENNKKKLTLSFCVIRFVVSLKEDNTCRIWDLKLNKVIKAIKGLSEPVMLFSFKVVLKHVYTYDLRTKDIILTEPVRRYEFSNDEINSIDVSDNDKFLATADDEGAVHIIDLCSHKIFKKTTKKHSNICMSVKFRPKKSWDVWSGGMDSYLFEWDFSRGSPKHVYDMSMYERYISDDGKWIAAGLGDSTLQVLSSLQQKSSSLQDVVLSGGHNAMVNCLSFVATSNSHQKDRQIHLVSGSPNSRFCLWSFNDTFPLSESLKPTIYQLDKSVGKLNHLIGYELNGNLYIVAAGTGALCIYTLQ
ncbi:WD40-repeat-containing domain protein [Mycotypha africana]|uniref:WD40-repeat-containing domain protein n=1 Tax=Mycotypha africana TaxID=64632 RepID=UPI002300A0A4|nr:WD40-repeat-containing domain protein [Mycotypha africana]KAI8982429.1 WD40-repeat-containing domain protein [Mycotypha africana]